MSNMTPELLQQLTPDQRAAWERCEKATSGPWQYDEMCPLSDGLYTWGEVNTADDTHTVAELDDAPICRVAPGLNVKHCPQYVDDGEFIAHARLDLPAALLQLAQVKRENDKLRQKLAEAEKVPDKQPPDCCDPKAEVVECANCGVPVHTCELETPVGGDYRCPSHPDGVELGNGSWVCSEDCGYEVDIESLRQKLVCLAALRALGVEFELIEGWDQR